LSVWKIEGVWEFLREIAKFDRQTKLDRYLKNSNFVVIRVWARKLAKNGETITKLAKSGYWNWELVGNE
jgi:hypothetical protein